MGREGESGRGEVGERERVGGVGESGRGEGGRGEERERVGGGRGEVGESGKGEVGESGRGEVGESGRWEVGESGRGEGGREGRRARERERDGMGGEMGYTLHLCRRQIQMVHHSTVQRRAKAPFDTRESPTASTVRKMNRRSLPPTFPPPPTFPVENSLSAVRMHREWPSCGRERKRPNDRKAVQQKRGNGRHC